MAELKVKSEDSLYNRPFAVDALGIFLIFLVAACMVACVDAMHGCTPGRAWADLCLSFAAFWLIFLNYKVRFFLLYLILLAVPAGLVLLPGDALMKLAYGVFAFFTIALGLYLRFSRKSSSEKESVTGLIAGMALFTVMWFVCEARDCAFFKQLLLTAALFYCFAYLLLLHESKIDYNLFIQNQMRMDQPVHRIKRFNRKLFLGFLAVVFLATELIILIPWDGEANRSFIATVLSYTIFWLWGKIMSLFKNSDPGTGPSIPSALESLEEDSAGGGGGLVPGTYSRFAEISGYIFTGLLMLAFLALVIWGLIRTLRYFSERSALSAELAHESEEIFETDERLERRASAGILPGFSLAGLSEEEKIRRRYFLKLRRQIGHTVLTSDTPSQSACKLKDPELEELVPLYESVRYSGHHAE